MRAAPSNNVKAVVCRSLLGALKMGAKMMGARVPRLEDPRLLRGQASFVDDLRMPGILHAAVLRSPHAHARIRKIGLSAVRAAAGVVDAFCLGDIWQNPPTIPVVGRASRLCCPARNILSLAKSSDTSVSRWQSSWHRIASVRRKRSKPRK